MKINRKSIIEVLRRSREPMGLRDIVHALDPTANRSTVHYHLKKMVEKGIIERYRDSTYGLVEVAPLDLEVLKTLKDDHLSAEGLAQNRRLRRYDTGDIDVAIDRLAMFGYIEESSRAAEGTPGTETVFQLSPAGANRIGVCAICGEELVDGHHVVAIVQRTLLHGSSDEEDVAMKGNLGSRPGATSMKEAVAIHPLCRLKILWLDDEAYSEDAVCAFCGLPLSPGLIAPGRVTYADISFALSKEELMTAEASISEAETKLETVEPNSLDELGLYRGIIFAFHDLSNLSEAESFVSKLAEKGDTQMTEESIRERAREIWQVARMVQEEQRHLIADAYSTLCGPWGIAYSSSEGSWALGYKPKEGLHGLLPGRFGPDGVALDAKETFAVRRDDKWYHPYCADRLEVEGRSVEEVSGI